MDTLIIKSSKAILVGIVLLRLVFVFNFPVPILVDKSSIELTEEAEGAEKLAAQEEDESFPADPFDWGFSRRRDLLTHYTHLAQRTEAYILEIVPPPPQG